VHNGVSSGARVIPDRLFVVSDAAALIADARCKGLLESRLSRFRKIIVHRGHGSFRRALNCVKGSLAYRVVAKFKGANINAYHAGTWERCEFAVGRIEAGNVKIPVVKLLVVRITDCAQRRSPVALERGDGAVLCAFDLIELEGEDLRRAPIEHRKRTLAKLVRTPHPGIVLNEHYEGDGAIIFREACKLGCEGIVSKRLGSPYRSGRVAHWVKVKNPKAPAIKREAEEDWGR
jgi:hypothetical protein